MINEQKTGITNLWVSLLPWQESLPWYFPTFTRINNVEK